MCLVQILHTAVLYHGISFQPLCYQNEQSLVRSSFYQNPLFRVGYHLTLNAQVGRSLLHRIRPFDLIVENQSAKNDFDFADSVKAADTGMLTITKSMNVLVISVNARDMNGNYAKFVFVTVAEW